MRPAELPLLLRTVRHIPPAQIAHRIRLRAMRAAYTRFPNGLEQRWADQVPAVTVGWPVDFEPIDQAVQHEAPRCSDAGRGTFDLVGESHDVLRSGWRPAERSQLFRYHLHYMEWAWPMAASGTAQDRAGFAHLWRSWRADTVAGRWDEWSPYVVSLRSWVLCGVFETLVRGTDIEADVVRHLRACTAFLTRNLELDVGGNHLIKNLKALVGLGVFLRSDEAVATATGHLGRQLGRQVLSDGGHFELSPSYHAQVLADLLDIHGLCRQLDPGTASVVAPHLAPMARWLGEMRFPDNSLPMLGDCSPPPPGLIDEIDRRLPPAAPRPVAHLSGSGYVVVRPQPDTAIIFDFGPPCPPELPAHAQADWGTFELWHRGHKLVVDPGVSTYSGSRRAYERSTLAHNTATVASANQTEVWGSFRAGRRHQPSGVSIHQSADAVTITAEVRYEGTTHQRLVDVRRGCVAITDDVRPAAQIEQTILLPREVHERSLLSVGWDDEQPATTETTELASSFGTFAPAVRHSAQATSPSSVLLSYGGEGE